MQAVHRAGLTHRDFKPGNILLARDRPRLIDFGVARAADDSQFTRIGGVVGSPGYLAPEQATGAGSAQPGDVFSLAAVLVHAAAGYGPFTGPEEEISTPALLYRVVHQEPDLDGVQAAAPPVMRCRSPGPGVRARSRPSPPRRRAGSAAPTRLPAAPHVEPVGQEIPEQGIGTGEFGGEPGGFRASPDDRIVEDGLQEPPDGKVVPVLEEGGRVSVAAVVDELRPHFERPVRRDRQPPPRLTRDLPEPRREQTRSEGGM